MNEAPDRAAAYGIFAAAFALTPGERAAFIRERCAGRPELEAVVLRLLALAGQDGALTGVLSGVALTAPPTAEADLSGEHFGPFRLVELLGSGGMGAVYRAERTDGVAQTVAVKILRERVSDAKSPQFRREASILARLDHPSIARLIDAGVEDGRGWIAMEFVRGQPITVYCASRGLDLAARVRLLITVADAVATAHRALIVHRDIKPSNVLVTEDGQPKLIDFGIASAIDQPGGTRAATLDVRALFTPHYAAPEQVRLEPVTVATDVFGLGALAYRVLTGVEPHANASTAVAYLLAVTQEDVDRPSAAARGGGELPGVARGLRGDLDCILTTALARDPAERYTGAHELEADLRAYLEGRPVAAHAPSVGYRLRKFVRRRAVPLGIATTLLVALGVAGVLYLAQERRVAQAQAAAARRGEFLEELLKSADPHQGRRDITVAELLDRAASTLPQSLRDEPLAEASMQDLLVDTNASLGRYDQGIAASDRELALLKAHGGTALDVARALISRGALLRTHARYRESADTLRQALKLLEGLANVAPEREAALHELGGALGNLGQEQEADTLLRAAIALEPQLTGKARVEAITAENDLAVNLGNQGRYAESVEVARSALADARRYLPTDHPFVLIGEGNYAMALLNLHQPAAAEPLLRDIVAVSSRVNGPQARDTLIAEIQLGETLLDLRRFDEAENRFRAAATGLDATEGPETRFATGAWNDFALAACGGTDAAAGLTAAQRNLGIRARTLAAGDWHLEAARVAVAFCEIRLGRYPEAEALLQPAAAALVATRGPDFYATQVALKALRELYEHTGRPHEAERVAARIKD
ncbi:MAG: serine/threonine protein kinase [Proteobacteria bacterium]|nr:serine/threonine protein kinase [Pseudomonadota bacterium]